MIHAIWALVVFILELMGARMDWARNWAKEEIDSKPRNDVI